MKTRPLLFALIALAAVLPAFARPVEAWTYDKLKSAADLIVIATPVAVQETTEQTVLPGIEVAGPDNKPTLVAAIGMETSFEIQTTFKGSTPLNRFILHYLREANPPATPVVDGPQLVSFDTKKKVRYLMFLKKDKDGHYISVTGQTDPGIAITALGSYP